MEIAVTGLPNPAEGLKPHDTNELITVEQAFQALTLNGAWQMGLENERGSIKVGKYADFVLADQDVFECAVTDIHKTKVVSTWFEGEEVYHVPTGSEEHPWQLGAGVTAWVDEALTNLAAVVIDNGHPAETNVIDLVALTNGIADISYEPAVEPFDALLAVEKDGGAPEYVRPFGWIGANGGYETLEAALEAGERFVIPDFQTKGAEVPHEIVEKGEGSDGKTYTAIVENVPPDAEAGIVKPVKASRADGLIGIATNEQLNVRLVVETIEELCIPTNDIVAIKAASVRGIADVVDYAADYFDLSIYFGEESRSETDEVLAIHVPWAVIPRQVYRVSRIHEGVPEVLPAGAENAVGGEYFEVFADEIVIHTKKFSFYVIGEIEQTPRVKVVVGDGEKTLGEADPSSLATNFTVNVQGVDFASEDICGYCVRAKGEAEGEYAVNFVCTKRPQGYDGEFTVIPGVFKIVMGEKLPADGTVAYPKAAKGFECLKPNANATWKAKPDACSVFVKWAAGEDASAAVTNLLSSAGDKVYKTSITLKIPADAEVKPTDVVATWKRIDEDVPAGQAAVMLRCDPTMGTVKGSGLYALGKDGTKKVSINATANRDYVFAGWYEDPGFSKPAVFWTGSGKSLKPKDYREASQSITVTTNAYLFARFVAKTTKADPITRLRFLGAGYCGADASEFAEDETWYQGVALPANCTIAFGSASLPTVTVSGLPAGVKIDKVSRCFTGAPTAASTEKKPFFTVKVTVKNKSGATDVLVKNIRVEPLPAWAVGNFDGYHMEGGETNGTFTATVGKTGKVSGKTAGGFAETSFATNCFSGVTLDGDALCYVADVTVSYKDPETKKTVKTTDTLYLMENPATKLGMVGGGDADGNGSVGVQRAWDRKEDDVIGFNAFPAIDTKALKDPVAIPGTDLTLKFDAKGKVTLGGTVDGVKASGTTYVLPLAWHSLNGVSVLKAQVCVYVAAKRDFSGCCAVFDFLLTAGSDGTFASVAFPTGY